MERTCDLLKQAKEGNKEARDQLVAENVGLVWSVARRFQGRGYDIEDLFQIGSIGLLKCIDHFDLSREVQFSTYAVPLIMGEIRRYIRDEGIVKVSRSLKELSYKIKKQEDLYEKKYHRAPTLREIVEDLQAKEEDVIMALESGKEVCSLNQIIYQSQSDEILLEDKLETKKDVIEESVNQMYVEQLMETLDERERQLIRMRYYQNQTQSAIAKTMGISQVQVSRLEKKILKKLREWDKKTG